MQRRLTALSGLRDNNSGVPQVYTTFDIHGNRTHPRRHGTPFVVFRKLATRVGLAAMMDGVCRSAV